MSPKNNQKSIKIHVHKNVKNQCFSWEGHQKMKVRAFKNQQKIILKLMQISISFLIYFLMDFLVHVGPMLGPKIHLKSIKNLSKNNIKKSLVFWLILCWFLLDFGSKLGGPRGSNEPAFRWLVGSWGQDSPKRPPRAPQEPPKSLQDPSKRAFGTDFGSIFDRFWMHFWQMFCGLVVDFW